MFNYDSKRAKLARFSKLFESKWLRKGLVITSLVLLSSWIYLVWFTYISAAHLLLVAVSLTLMPVIWYRGFLEYLPTSKGETIEDLARRDLLARLPKDPSPKDVADVVSGLPGGRFFSSRFAISRDFITQLSSASSADMNTVWNYALQLSKRSGSDEITAAHVFAALIYSLPEYNFYLAQLNLDSDDIESGLKWYQHINEVIINAQKKKFHGGLGRDLSFGWTPLLSRLGYNISEEIQGGGLLHRQVASHEDVLAQMMHLLGQPGRRNATLVGEVGVGKTTLAYALAQKLLEDKSVPKELAYRQIITLDSSSLIAQAKGRGELEGLLIRIFNEAAHAKNIILFLDEAQLFLQEGTGSVDLSNILLPVLEGGGIRLILAMSDQQWLQISQLNPGLSQLMNRVVVAPLERDETMQVVQDQILLLEGRNNITYMHQGLEEAYKLADRFIRDQAFPGKAIRLLEAAAGFAEQKYFITAQSVQQAVEKSYDVKVQNASTVEERDTLLNLEGKIHERMINQTRAVQVVSDALRRARAGVRNEGKPIGTFLFLGPTGVGKTELSKALASVYFGGEDRMVRVDLNEYSQAQDVSRLIATPSQYAESLCAKISKQPFSVVLLDEIEKAHQSVLDVLLQMLDEGILRDAENKQVSFRDAIVIATSNAGADRIREHIENGESLEQFEDQFMDELISANIFRPEFINRFDETVLFRPLTVEELMQVVDLIVISINKTLAGQKVSVRLTDGAKAFLAQAGYDPRLGARPLRRVTQRSIENIMAQKLLSGEITPGSTLQLDTPDLQAALAQRG